VHPVALVYNETQLTSNLHTPEENNTLDRQGTRIFKKGHLIIKVFILHVNLSKQKTEKSNNISSQNLTSDTIAGCTLRGNKAT
jgi:hypothetical protein